MQLRIIEQRHIRLVKESIQNKQGFGIVNIKTQAASSIGTRVETIDFFPLEAGLLGITVKGKERFIINKLEEQFDGLTKAEIHLLANWKQDGSEAKSAQLVQKLRDIFKYYPQLDKLYKNKDFEDPTWLCQRWLEILPMPSSQKQDLISQSSCNKTLKHLNRLMAT